MKKYDYLIVGAGLFGAVFAQRATAKGRKCLVIDKRNHIAGNVYTEKCEGINVHKYGAHIFHTDNKKVWDYVNQFADFNNFVNSPLANYKGKLYNLPFNMHTFYEMWGVTSPDEARKIIDRQKKEITGTPKNLEEQAISLVGRDIYEALIKGYTEKQWGRDCKALPSFIIKRIPVRFTFDNNYFSDRYQGIPIGGYTEMVKKMLKGCDVKLSCDYFETSELSDLAEKTVFTGRIDEFFGKREGALEYRTLKFENEILDTEDYQGVAVINSTEREIPYTRTIEHKHFERTVSNKTVITREYPCEFTEGAEAYYPVNDEKNQEIYGRYKALAEKNINVIFGGRLGTYKYMDMDDTVEAALTLAEKEL